MSKTVIKVENLSKQYRLGLKEKKADTLTGQVANILKSPWENFKRLRQLNRFGVEDESVFWALKDINFEVKEGEVLGIIGKNGAGKSTLLKILSQITDPSSGQIEIHGRVASLLEVGTGFHPELSGRENIYMNGTILGMTRREIDSKLDEIIDFSGVEKFIDTPVKHYSSGMKVRLGFSVAAHLDPEILIIDEVLAVGDFEFQKKCLGKMEEINSRLGRTIIFVSHDLMFIKNFCKSCVLLNDGKISSHGNTNEVAENYLNLFKDNENTKHQISVLENFINYSNGKLEIKLSLVFKFNWNNINIGFVVKNEYFTPVFGSNSNMSDLIILKCDFLSFEFIVNQMYLLPGVYFIDLFIGDGLTEMITIKNILTFSVSENFFIKKIDLLPSQKFIGSASFLVNWKISYD